MKYVAIIFDLFGTLVDSYSVQGYNRLLTDMASAPELPGDDFRGSDIILHRVQFGFNIKEENFL